MREALFEIYTWILCLSYLHEKQTSRIQSLNKLIDPRFYYGTRQRKAWHPLAKGGGGQSLPWPMILWPKIDIFPHIIHNLRVKCETDWT